MELEAGFLGGQIIIALKMVTDVEVGLVLLAVLGCSSRTPAPCTSMLRLQQTIEFIDFVNEIFFWWGELGVMGLVLLT